MDLEAFHAGAREVLARVYREHVGRVERAVSRYCRGVDAECVVHEVFLAVIERPEIRQQFTGGDLGAWLATMAGRRAIDHLRRRRRWTLLDDPRDLEGRLEPVDEEEGLLHRDQVAHLEAALQRFAAEVLPGLDRRLVPVFEQRYLQRRSQAEAARRLGLARTTLIDREQRLLRTLGPFLARCFPEAQP
jgi:RNA polymerase sigma factor (sigma-70 family)